MKKLSLFVLASTLMITSARADFLGPKVKAIGLPCLASIAIGQALNSLNSGLVVCAATATYVLVDEANNPYREQAKMEMENFLKDSKKSLDSHFAQTKEDYLLYQEAVRKIVTEKLSEIQGTSDRQIEAYMKAPAFEKFLKEKTLELIKQSDDVISKRLEKAKEDIRRQVTEEVLRDVIETTQGQ